MSNELHNMEELEQKNIELTEITNNKTPIRNKRRKTTNITQTNIDTENLEKSGQNSLPPPNLHMRRKNSIDNTTNLYLEKEMTAKAGLGNMQCTDNDNNKQAITNSDTDNTDLEIETKSTSNDQMEIANSTMNKLDNLRSPCIITPDI